MKRLFGILVLFCTCFVLPSAAQETLPDYVGYHLQEANRLRAEQGLAPFAYNEQLAEAATDQANWMIRNWSYAHYHGGSTPTTRAKAAGYANYDWCCTENTFLSPTTTAEAAMRFWLNSPPHYRQLMSDEYDEIGVGFAIGSERTGQVIVFGRRNGVAPTTVPTNTPIEQPVVITNNAPAASGCAASHTVQVGENLFRIGLRYGVSMATIAAQNGIVDMTRIYVGQVLCIPSGGAVVVPSNIPTNTGNSSTTNDTSSAINTDNWCYPGNIWGDGRCNDSSDPAIRNYMWQCGWYGAHGIPTDECDT